MIATSRSLSAIALRRSSSSIQRLSTLSRVGWVVRPMGLRLVGLRRRRDEVASGRAVVSVVMVRLDNEGLLDLST